MVARGVIAKAIDHLWDDVDRIDVIYICSNAEIARQNANRLNPLPDIQFAQATRLTLLPETIHDLRHNKLNFVALTPGTSFEAHSSEGMARERVLLYLMLRDSWDLGDRMGAYNVFCYSMGQQRFREWVKWSAKKTHIDPDLKQRFLARPELARLRVLFDETQEHFKVRRDRSKRSDEAKALQRELIGSLRMVLAHSCVDALEPDLVILDEFQRFKHLLGQGEKISEAGELAQQLFEYEAEDSDERAKTLLLSATPYSAYGVDPDDPGRSHQAAFAETVSFLVNDERKLAEIDHLFKAQFEVLTGRANGENAGREAAEGIRRALTKVMCRTERLGATANRDGMLKQVNHEDQTLKTDDVMAYLATQRVARYLGHADMIEFWKSAPYLINLMDHYKFKRDLEASADEGLSPEIRLLLEDGAPGMLDREVIAEYGAIDPGNSRLRVLVEEIINEGIWKLLWLNPSLPYYEPDGPFASAGARKFTKRLVFSAWRVVPRAISILTSYAVQQQLASEAGVNRNSPEVRARRSGRLLFAKEGSVSPVFALVWPSQVLADLGDPLRFGSRDGGAAPSKDRLVRAIAEELQPRLDRLASRRSSEGGEEQAWYWAAPLLLDFFRDPERTCSFLARETEIARERIREAEKAGRKPDIGWLTGLEKARELIDGELVLGFPPDDLSHVLAEVALGGFGVAAYRSLCRRIDSDVEVRDLARERAVELGSGLRGVFNLPEANDLIRGLDYGRSYWRNCLNYAIDGNIQSVLDEFAHVLRDHLGHVTDANPDIAIQQIADEMLEAMSMRASSPSVDFFGSTGERRTERDRERLRMNFAIPFGDHPGESDAIAIRSDQVRKSFNSPFWPFVLSSTSVGQEGLDFHLYCHALIHWNLPSNPVDMEQREGRVHRYKNHAVRKNLAQAYGPEALGEKLRGSQADPWKTLFELGEKFRPQSQTELWPYWIFLPEDEDPAALIERHVMALPLSRDRFQLENLLNSLILYRGVLGQPRQEDLVATMQRFLDPEEADAFAEQIRIDLSPPFGLTLERDPSTNSSASYGG